MWDIIKGMQRKSLLPFIFYRATGNCTLLKFTLQYPELDNLRHMKILESKKFQLWQKLSNFASKHKNIP